MRPANCVYLCWDIFFILDVHMEEKKVSFHRTHKQIYSFVKKKILRFFMRLRKIGYSFDLCVYLTK